MPKFNYQQQRRSARPATDGERIGDAAAQKLTDPRVPSTESGT